MSALEIFFGLTLLITAIKAVKLQTFYADPAIGLEDLALAALLALAASYLPIPVAIAATIFFLLLWFDAVLFRAFTIELGTGGLGTVVFTMLFRELAELAHVRRFFAHHKIFAWLPPISFAVVIQPSANSLILSAALIIYLGLLAATTPRPARGTALLLWAAGTAATALRLENYQLPPYSYLGFTAVLISARLSAIRAEDGFFGRASFFRQFFGWGRLPDARSFTPREEHLPLLTHAAQPPRTSALFGRADKANVILITVESLGRDHLAHWAGEARGALMPFLEERRGRGVSSAAHFCISPNTNNSHVALYASNYSASEGLPNLAPLLEAEYRTIYLSAIDTADYGLRALLEKAGFEHILDRSSFDAHQGGDYVLLDRAPDQLAELVKSDERPWFLHIHTTNTHVPYLVIDQQRFKRFALDDDRGRFLDGLEETDFILGSFFKELEKRGLLDRPPLLVITGDHGQAFGEMGYLSHGSAVIKEEINVPLIVHHPALGPKSIAFSSHFDVLPTIQDLLGLRSEAAGFGDSIFADRANGKASSLLLWAGHPSRSKSSNFGLLVGPHKYMVDLIAGRCYQMSWDDQLLRELSGEEKKYWTLLIHNILTRRGLT